MTLANIDKQALGFRQWAADASLLIAKSLITDNFCITFLRKKLMENGISTNQDTS